LLISTFVFWHSNFSFTADEDIFNLEQAVEDTNSRNAFQKVIDYSNSDHPDKRSADLAYKLSFLSIISHCQSTFLSLSAISHCRQSSLNSNRQSLRSASRSDFVVPHNH